MAEDHKRNKVSRSFWLSKEANALLAGLAKLNGTSKSAELERAIRAQARREEVEPWYDDEGEE